MGTGKENSSRFFYLSALILVLSLVPGAGALAVTVTPDQIREGDQVSIGITGLSDNSTFSLQIEGTFAVNPGGAFSFETRNLVMPFALREGSLSATLRNTATNVLTVQKGDTEVRKVGSSQGGVFSTSETGSIPAGTYDLISLAGTAAPGSDSIVAGLTLQGKKDGPDDSVITFLVQGVTGGLITVTVTVDGETALSRTIVVGDTMTATPTVTTTTTTTATPTTSGGSGGGGSGGGITTSGGLGTTTTTATPTRTATPAPTLTAAAQTTAPETPAGTAPVTTPLTSPAAPAAEKTSPPPTRSGSYPAIAALAVCMGALVLFIRYR